MDPESPETLTATHAVANIHLGAGSDEHEAKFILTSSYFSSKISFTSDYFKDCQTNFPNKTFYSIHLTWIDFFPINN